MILSTKHINVLDQQDGGCGNLIAYIWWGTVLLTR